MNEWLTDTEKRILLSALSREKEICIKVDKECCREPYETNLEDVCKSLERKFYYDRLFKQMEKQIRQDAEKEHSAMCESCIHKVSADDIEAIRISAIDECIEIVERYTYDCSIIKKLERLKESEND